jgi:hypothetical protein
MRLVTLMEDIPEQHKELYKPEWDAAVNRLTNEFLRDFCYENGHINWEGLVEFVSAEVQPKAPTQKSGRTRIPKPPLSGR